MMNNPLINTRVKEETWWTFLEFASKYLKSKTYVNDNPVYNPISETNWKGVNFIAVVPSFAPLGFARIREWATEIVVAGTQELPLFLEEMFLATLLNRYAKHYCISGETIDGIPQNVVDFYNSLTNIWSFTKDKYIWLLQAYQSERDNLLNKVRTIASGTSRFNDTPQEDGTFDQDEHTSHITQTSGETSSDIKPLIERLDDISSKFQNVLLDWCNEFDKLFIEGDNV